MRMKKFFYVDDLRVINGLGNPQQNRKQPPLPGRCVRHKILAAADEHNSVPMRAAHRRLNHFVHIALLPQNRKRFLHRDDFALIGFPARDILYGNAVNSCNLPVKFPENLIEFENRRAPFFLYLDSVLRELRVKDIEHIIVFFFERKIPALEDFLVAAVQVDIKHIVHRKALVDEKTPFLRLAGRIIQIIMTKKHTRHRVNQFFAVFDIFAVFLDFFLLILVCEEKTRRAAALLAIKRFHTE